MTNRFSYFILRASMFGIGFFLLYQNTGKDAYISAILGTLLGLLIILFYDKLKKVSNNKIKESLNHTIIGKIYIFILLLFNIYTSLVILTIMPMFVNSFYLVNTPKIVINIFFLLITVYVSLLNKNVLEKLSKFLYIVSLFVIVLFMIFIIKYFDYSNILPIFSYKSIDVISSSLIYASITAIPQILVIDYNNNLKDNIKNYLYGSLTILLILLADILSLGDTLLKIYSFPEYVALKQIEVLKFIENIENVSSFIWYFDVFIYNSLLNSNLKHLLPNKNNNYYYFPIIIMILFIATFIIGTNYRIIITLFYTYPFVLFIFFLLFISLYLYLIIKKLLKK